MFSKDFARACSWFSRILVSCCMLLSGQWAGATITANVTLTNYAGFVTLNPGLSSSGMLVIMRAPTNDPNSRISIAWPTYTGDQLTPQAVSAGSTGGYFWVVFNNDGAMEANGCTTNPVSASTPTAFISDGGSFNVNIVCSGPPAAPTSLVATPGNGQMSIAFTPGSAAGSPITNYQYSFDGGGLWTALSPPDALSPVGITGLTNGTSYSVMLRAVNAIGPGAASSAVVTTPRTIADDATGVTATPGDTQATITFTAPAFNGGAAITGYTATADPDGATGSCVGAAACSITVPGLTNGTPYTFTVTAANAAGTNNPSVASNAVTPKANQTISFSNPGARNFGTAPTLSATATSGLTPTFSSSTTGVCTITSGGSLTFVTGGTCSIDANQAGNSTINAAPTVTQSFTVNATVPGAPTGVNAAAGDTQVSLSFTAPSSNGGASITSYVATASPGGATGSSPTSPVTVTGLTNGTAYTFTVTATNSVGTGSASVASNSVTPKGSQTITFLNPGAKNFGTSPTLSASASSGLTPTFTSATTGVCTITSGGTLTFVAAGTCTIYADQGGNGIFNAATQAQQSFTVNAIVPDAPTIGTATAGNTQASVTFAAPASNGGAAITIYTATANPGGATGTCAGPAACTITVTGLTNGVAHTFTVTATNTAGTGSASAASNAVTPKATQTITFVNPGTRSFGTTPTLSATSDSGLSVTFTSSTTGVCTITPLGALSFITPGTCTIHADQPGNGSYLAGTQVSQSFTVVAVVPGAPTIGVASPGDAMATISFAAPAFTGGATITGYTVTSNPGGHTGTGAMSPIVVPSLTNSVAYTFTVTATNSAGTGSASAASNSVTPNPGPVVASVAVPANGAYSTGQNLDFTISWDSNTTVTGTPRLSLVIGATTVHANYVSSPTATTTLFRYTVLAGQNDTDGIAIGALALNGGTIQNAASINATLTLNSVGSTTNVLVDTTAPTLPAANVVVNNQADPHKVVLTFSENLDNTSLGAAANWTVTANGGTPTFSVASVALSGGKIVTLTLSPVDVTNGTTTIKNVAAAAHLKVTPPATLKDVAGNTYAAGMVIEAGATHVLDATAPTLSGVAASASTAGGGSLAATASEKSLGYWIAVASGSAAPNVTQTRAGVNYGAVTVVAYGSGALPSAVAGSISLAGLAPSTSYDIYLVAEDAAGNLSAGVATTPLTTSATPSPFTPLAPAAPVPGVKGIPTVVDMASGNGPAMGSCVADVVRQALGGNATYVGQSASGATQIAWNGQLISFYPLTASTANSGATGIRNQSINPLDVVSTCGTLNVTPAVYSLSELGATLTSMGLTAEINAQGVITVVVNGVVYVVRPDFIVTPGTPGAPRLFVGADSLYRFTDSAGNTQIMRPAFLDPAALQIQIGLLGGSMSVQVDAAVFLSLGGQTFTLTPDITLGGIPPAHAADNQWQDGPTHYMYRIQTQPYANYGQGAGLAPRP